MNVDLLGHWRGGAVEDAAEEAIREYGLTDAINNINIGPLESMYGAKPDHVRNYILRKQQQAINADPTIQALAVQAGDTGFASGTANWGENRVATATRLNQQIKENADKLKKRKSDNKVLMMIIGNKATKWISLVSRVGKQIIDCLPN